jgi:hypothetical protein
MVLMVPVEVGEVGIIKDGPGWTVVHYPTGDIYSGEYEDDFATDATDAQALKILYELKPRTTGRNDHGRNDRGVDQGSA